jgi:hypothetical protein
VQLLQDALSAVADKLQMPELHNAIREGSELDQMLSSSNRQNSIAESVEHSPQEANDRSWEVDPRCEPSSMPATCIAEVRETDADPNSLLKKPTLVSKGIVKVHQARVLFTLYHDRLDHLLYQILGDDMCLDTALESSPLLVAAVCTVAALHSTQFGHLFEPCLAELKHLVSSESLSRKHNMDDIRGLCVGGFWLSSLSWALSGSGKTISQMPRLIALLMVYCSMQL